VQYYCRKWGWASPAPLLVDRLAGVLATEGSGRRKTQER
jgi:hypothetical protein